MARTEESVNPRKAPKPQKTILENQNSHISNTHSQASWTLQTHISQTCTSQMCTHGDVYLVDVHLTYIGVHLTVCTSWGCTSLGMHLMGLHLMRVSHRRACHGRVSDRRVSHGHVCHRDKLHRHEPHGRASHACVSFTSLPCAQDTGGENLCIGTEDGLKASDCGRLGRQAAGPCSALRVVKSCRKDCPTVSVLPKPKQQLCIQKGTRPHYLTIYTEGGRGGEKKRRQSDWLSGDRQTGQNKTDERWYPSRPCTVLNSGL